MVVGLRAMPAPRMPADFTSRLMARYAQVQDTPELAASVAEATRLPEVPPEAATTVQAPLLVPVPQTVPPPPAWMPREAPRRQSSYRSFYAMAASIACVFFIGLMLGKSGNTKLGPKDLATSVPRSALLDAMLPVNMKVDGPTGQVGAWNPARVQLVSNPDAAPLPENAELSVQLPPDVRMEVPDQTPNVVPTLIPVQSMGAPQVRVSQAHQIVIIPVSTLSGGQWERQLRWRVERRCNFQTVVEFRCDGAYRREIVTFQANQ